MDGLVLYGIPIAALIVGLVEMAKRSLSLPDRWAPVLALALGVVFAVLGWLEFAEASLLEQVLLGLMTGLMAAGLYSGTKATVLNK